MAAVDWIDQSLDEVGPLAGWLTRSLQLMSQLEQRAVELGASLERRKKKYLKALKDQERRRRRQHLSKKTRSWHKPEKAAAAESDLNEILSLELRQRALFAEKMQVAVQCTALVQRASKDFDRVLRISRHGWSRVGTTDSAAHHHAAAAVVGSAASHSSNTTTAARRSLLGGGGLRRSLVGDDVASRDRVERGSAVGGDERSRGEGSYTSSSAAGVVHSGRRSGELDAARALQRRSRRSLNVRRNSRGADEGGSGGDCSGSWLAEADERPPLRITLGSWQAENPAATGWRSARGSVPGSGSDSRRGSRPDAAVPRPLAVDLAEEPRPAEAAAVVDAAPALPAAPTVSVELCPVCGEGEKDAMMVACDGCDRWFHTDCVGFAEAPDADGDWFCGWCAPQRNRMGQAPVV